MSVLSKSKKVMKGLKSKAVITAFGFLCLALLIWFGGPLLAIAGYEPLVSSTARLVILLLFAIIWGAINLTYRVKDKKDNEKMVDSLINGDDGGSASDELAKNEIAQLQKKMLQALDILKATRFDKNKNIYNLPWYIMIGPPGAGKTTAIQNSGLEYPLKEKMGIDMVQGVGGTRHCDWWFTNKAVLIDTAGRYTTQDSHVTQDSRAWQGFLGLLKKFRPIRPINGVIISMGMAELLKQTKTERNLHARAIKQRLQELQNQLGMTFPVYVLLSKADLVAGFNEFFDDLTEQECQQIWGVTFPLISDDNQMSTVSNFNKEFHGLLSHLNRRINRRLKTETNLERRAAIYQFPKQLRLLQSAADDFLKEIFSPNAYEEAPMLRGVYLISATQEGIPINHLPTHLPTEKHNNRQTINTGETRGYFIKNLLEEVIFPEKNLASTNRRYDKKNVRLRRIFLAAATVGTFSLSYAWWDSYQWNRELVDQTEQAIEQYQQGTSGGLTDQTEIITLTKGLTALRELPVGYAKNELADAHTLGLYQGDKLKQPAGAAYQRALEGYFMPYLLEGLVDEMQINSAHLNYLYETLKIYLMFFNSQYFQSEDIKIWFSAYFDRHVPGDINKDIRRQLNLHLATALTLRLKASVYNDVAVEQARSLLTMLPLVERAYQRLKSDFIESSIPDFKLVDIISTDSLHGFIFNSERKLSAGIPGLFTYNGFHGIFSIEKNRIIKRLIADSWVYGDDLNGLDSKTKSEIMTNLEQKYIRDYIFYWEEFINDLSVKPYTNLTEAALVTQALSGPDSPIKTIITAIQKNVQLTKLPLSTNAKAVTEVVKSASEVAFASQKSRISRLLPNKPVKIDVNLPGKDVELAFTDLLTIEVTQLDELQTTLRAINRNLVKINFKHNQRTTMMNPKLESSFIDLGDHLAEQIIDIPFPIANWLEPIARQTQAIAQVNQNERLNDIWQSEVLAEYKRAIKGKYPFNRHAKKEVRLKDFSRFFGHNGTLAKFWKKHLINHVDTSKKPWRFFKDIGINPDILAMYENAEKIKDSFFERGVKNPRIHFSLQPDALDRNVSLFMLEIDGQQLNYRHGPPRKQEFIWPGPNVNSETRIVFTPPNGGRSINMKYTGEWSIFRFLNQLSQERPKTKKDGLLKIALSGYNAQLKFTPNSVNNPFWRKNLERFTCPSQL